MADVLKLLVTTGAARNPTGAAAAVSIYQVPALTSAMVSRIMVANRTAGAIAFRIALVRSGETLGNEHYVAYDISCLGNDTVDFPVGAGLATGDQIYVYAAATGLTFTPMGLEVTG